MRYSSLLNCLLLAVLLAIGTAGCASSRKNGSAGGSGEGAGSSSVALEQTGYLQVKSAGELKISQPSTGHLPPSPDGALEVPVYPKAALAKRLGIVVVHMTVKIGPEGRVTGVERDSSRFSTPTPMDPMFDAAIAEAAQKWRFQPGFAVPLIPGKDGATEMGNPIAEAAELDASITFSASGGVTISAGR